MPFDRGTKSCWTFFCDLHHDRVPVRLIPILLECHMLECNCPCQPCQRLRQLWVEAGRKETNGAAIRKESR